MASSLTRSKLIALIAKEMVHKKFTAEDVDFAVKYFIDMLADTIVEGERIEVRDFGSFTRHFRAPRLGRNPRTGDPMLLEGKHVPHFKPGKRLRDRVNETMVKEMENNRRRSEAAHG